MNIRIGHAGTFILWDSWCFNGNTLMGQQNYESPPLGTSCFPWQWWITNDLPMKCLKHHSSGPADLADRSFALLLFYTLSWKEDLQNSTVSMLAKPGKARYKSYSSSLDPVVVLSERIIPLIWILKIGNSDFEVKTINRFALGSLPLKGQSQFKQICQFSKQCLLF